MRCLGWARGRTSHPSAFQPLIALRHLLLCVLHWPLELWTSATWSCGLRCLRSWSRSCASAPRPIGEVRVHLYTVNRCCWLQTDSGGEAAAVIDEKKVRTEPPPPPLKTILRKAAKRAIGGGLSGWIAGVVQVICLMWLRTAMK